MFARNAPPANGGRLARPEMPVVWLMGHPAPPPRRATAPTPLNGMAQKYRDRANR
ncbi:hypothetical protein EVAR_70334_1, partial [Eumeta japonica]